MGVNDTIRRIEQRVRAAPSMADPNKEAVLALLRELQQQLAEVPERDRDKARSVAAFTEVSTLEATRESRDAKLQDLALRGLQRSVREFENSHPKLIEIINAICTTLSNIGI